MNQEVEPPLGPFQQEDEVFGGQPAPVQQEPEVFGGLPTQQPTNEDQVMGGLPMSPEEANRISTSTMHEDMEDEITPKRRRGRPRKKIKKIAPTEIDEKEKPTIINVDETKNTNDVDLNQGFDIEDARETEEK